jgi:hypothetical protein
VGGSGVSLRLIIPDVDSARLARFRLLLRRGAAVRIQKTFRGFTSRCLYRRLLHRRAEVQKQAQRARALKAEIDICRLWRSAAAARLQARVRGWLWRARLRLLHHHAAAIQRVYRILLGHRRIAEDARRAADGAQVVEVLQAGVRVEGRVMNAVVSRCEGHFKVTGYDLVRCAVYEAFVYRDEVAAILDQHNRDMSPGAATRVRAYQVEAVARVLLGRLRMVTLPGDRRAADRHRSSSSDDTGANDLVNTLRGRIWGSDLIRVYLSGPRQMGAVDGSAGLDRTLQDQAWALTKYQKLLRRQRGLGHSTIEARVCEDSKRHLQ